MKQIITKSIDTLIASALIITLLVAQFTLVKELPEYFSTNHEKGDIIFVATMFAIISVMIYLGIKFIYLVWAAFKSDKQIKKLELAIESGLAKEAMLEEKSFTSEHLEEAKK